MISPIATVGEGCRPPTTANEPSIIFLAARGPDPVAPATETTDAQRSADPRLANKRRVIRTSAHGRGSSAGIRRCVRSDSVAREISRHDAEAGPHRKFHLQKIIRTGVEVLIVAKIAQRAH